MFYIYQIRFQRIDKRERFEWSGLTAITIRSSILSKFLDELEKTYPKTNFLKLYFDFKNESNILIADRPVGNIGSPVYFVKEKDDIPHAIKTRLKLYSTPEDYNILNSIVHNFITNVQYKRHSADYFRLSTNSSGWYSFGPNHKEVYKDKFYWKVMAMKGGGL